MKFIRNFPSLLVAALAAFTANNAMADTIGAANSAQINYNINYAAVDANGATVSEYRIFDGNGPRVGNSYTAPTESNNYATGLNANSVAVFFFQLPDLGSVSAPFSTATLSIGFSAYAGGGQNGIIADIYGLGVQATKTAQNSMYFVGANDTTGGVTKIADDFLSSSSYSANSLITTSVASSALADYLNAAYANGANAGKYVVLRISPESASQLTGASGYNLASFSNATIAPFITYSVAAIPEPSAIAAIFGLAVLGCAGILRMRRNAVGKSC